VINIFLENNNIEISYWIDLLDKNTTIKRNRTKNRLKKTNAIKLKGKKLKKKIKKIITHKYRNQK